MSETTARLSLLRKIALACAVLVLAITSLSAFMRQSRAGLGCDPWPECYAARATMSAEAAGRFDSALVDVARVSHRIAASAALLLVIALIMKAYAQQPVLPRQGRLALALLGIALFLAVLGRMAGDSRLPLVTLGNLTAGFAMFAVSCRLVQASGPGAPAGSDAARRLRPWIVAALAVLVLQVALGALVSSAHVANRCGESTLCQWHRATGLATAAMLLPLGVLAWRAGQRLGAVVAAGVVGAAGLGLLVSTSAQPLGLALAHNLVAALLGAALLALLRPRAGPATAPSTAAAPAPRASAAGEGAARRA